MSYVPAHPSDLKYSVLPTTADEVTIDEETLRLIRRSSRWVVFLCFVQLLMSLFAMLAGGIFLMIVTTIFVSLGLAGVRRQHARLLIAHFVYSLLLYIMTLIGVVMMFVYCDHCSLWLYLVSSMLVVFQAIGLRHSRMLIFFAKKYNPTSGCCAKKCSSNKCTQTPAPAPEKEIPVAQPPQYIPMQSVRYPVTMNGMPVAMMPMPPMTQPNPSAPQPQMYPVLAPQFYPYAFVQPQPQPQQQQQQ